MPAYLIAARGFRTLPVTLALLILAACGGHGSGPVSSVEPAAASAPPASQSLAEAIAEVDAAPVPDGVDPEVFAMLQAELKRCLTEQGAERITSLAPHGDANVVDDLFLYDDAGGSHLEWTYRNQGDYNRDGLVGVSDLTSIGQHYEASIYDDDWDKARWADGNSDGLVTVGDITPIGQKYNTFVAGYHIHGAADTTGERTLVRDLPGSELTGDSFFDVHVELDGGKAGYDYYWITPVDGTGEEGVTSVVSRRTCDPAVVTLGTDTILSTETIGEDGGDVNGPVGTPLEGLGCSFLPGTVPDGTSVGLGINDGDIIPVNGEFTGKIVVMESSAAEFALPVEVTVPYPRDDWDYVYVPYLVAEDGSLAPANLLEHDKELGHMKFTAMHPSKFAILKVLVEALPPGLWLTTYYPGNDGFQVYNFGSAFSPGGQCAGMSFFSRWYWINKMAGHGHFFNKYMYDVGSNYVGQHLIGIRAHTSLNRVYGQTKAMYLWYEDTATDEQNFTAICNSLMNSGRPVVIGLTKTYESGGHAVLAYGFEDAGLRIYDPNAAGDPRFITYNAGSSTFTPYGPFDNIYLAGDDTGVATYESFENIWHDANYGFTNHGFAEVHVQSHADGEIVATGTADIYGYVASGQLLADTLNMYVEGICYTRSLPENGYFEFNGTPIGWGVNDIWFQVYGTSQGGPAFIPVEEGFELDLTGSSVPPVLGVTLVWDQANTDLDLYVTDPNGDTAWYGHLTTPDGSLHHGNVTDGYGPEYWEIRQNDILRWGQPYQVRVHYRDGDVNVVAHLGIRYYEGTAYAEHSLNPSWYFTSDHANTDPAATGNDWRTLAYIIPVNHYTSTATGGLRVEPGPDGVPTYYVPAVPFDR